MSTAVVAQSPQVDPEPTGTAKDQETAADKGNAGSPADQKEPQKSPATPHRRPWWLYILIAILVVGAVVYFGVMPRLKRDKATSARAAAQKSALPIVQVVIAARGSSLQHLSLPGTVTPAITVHVYAQAAGFLKARYVDIGDKVHRGQLLGLVSSPDLDATMMQQRSLLQESKDLLNKTRTAQQLAQVTFDRVDTLTQHGVLSQQEDDIARAALDASSADVRSAQNAVGAATASLQRATVMAAFEQIRSPIDGTVTARNIDVGSLVSSTGSGQGVAQTPASASAGPATGGAQGGELFQVSDLRDLRTFVAVPEQEAIYMGNGSTATLAFSEFPGESFSATIIRNNDSLSQQTRTLVVEMKIADPKHQLRPGMYATVQLGFNAVDPGILISGDSVITLAQGAFVAVVNDNIIHMRQVQTGRDLGTQIYITSGLVAGDVIVVNPTDVVQEGVHVVAQAAPKGQEK